MREVIAQLGGHLEEPLLADAAIVADLKSVSDRGDNEHVSFEVFGCDGLCRAFSSG